MKIILLFLLTSIITSIFSNIETALKIVMIIGFSSLFIFVFFLYLIDKYQIKTWKNFKKIFHKCKFELTDRITKNEKGEIWLDKCKCGKTRKIFFNNKGECVNISNI